MKPKKKKAKPSLLARLFGAKAKAKSVPKKAAKAKTPPDRQKTAPEKAPPPPRPTPLDRSIAEIKQMIRIGQNNPARLATILGSLIKAEQAKKAQADEKYQQLIQDILDRQQQREQQDSQNSGGE